MGRSALRFEPRSLLDRLPEQAPAPHRCWVAFSGGLDSTVLLHALAGLRERLPGTLRAVHANHGVHPQADEWQAHCASVCRRLDVALSVIGPPEPPPTDGSPEERLRRWRYQHMARLLEPGDWLCTAHHRDDQAETVLLALLRGSGPGGLGAMPERRALGAGLLVRPLLDTPRSDLRAWAQAHELTWCEDPSNADPGADRNYLRHEVLPVLRGRWPAVDRSLTVTARLCREAAAQIGAASDLALVGREPAPGVLALDGVTQDGPALRALLRRWLRRQGLPPLPRKQLEELVRQWRTTGPDRALETRWCGHRLRRHRGHLWLDGTSDLPPPDPGQWRGRRPFTMSGAAGVLTLAPAEAKGSGAEGFDAPLTVRFRSAGDRFRTSADRPSRSLKQWFGASPIPPWRRGAVPLVTRGDTILAVGDAVTDRDFAAKLDRAGRRLEWRPSEPALAWAWNGCRASLLQLE